MVNPGREVPAFIERFTGVTNEMTARAPKLASVRMELERFVGQSVVVGHNIGFDLHYLGREGVKLAPKAVDTAGLARYLLPTLQGHGLMEVAAELGIEPGDHHRALADARTAAAVFVGLLRRAEALPEGQRFQLARVRNGTAAQGVTSPPCGPPANASRSTRATPGWWFPQLT